MKSLSLISQVLTIGLSIAIVMLFIMPSWEDIGSIQTQIDEYIEDRETIESVNAELAGHLAKLSSISPSNVDRLTTYMPPFVDEIKVMRDVQFIVGASGSVFKMVEYGGVDAKLQAPMPGGDERLSPVAHQFSVIAEGTYSQIKDMLSLLEQNEYPLEVHSLVLTPIDGGFITLDAVLHTYADEVTSLEANDS